LRFEKYLRGELTYRRWLALLLGMNTKKSTPEFDLVIFGASGFTGRLVVEYILKQYGFRDEARSNVNWAIAGRNLEKLAALRDELGAPTDLPLLAADASVPASLIDVARRTKVIPDSD
jgi:short subunit dehydrogenase-like uncharacterized protein